MIIIGGNKFGGFVNDGGNNNPTYAIWPPDMSQNNGVEREMELLKNTLPANLYPITVCSSFLSFALVLTSTRT